jgi:hypothetical protein
LILCHPTQLFHHLHWLSWWSDLYFAPFLLGLLTPPSTGVDSPSAATTSRATITDSSATTGLGPDLAEATTTLEADSAVATTLGADLAVSTTVLLNESFLQ